MPRHSPPRVHILKVLIKENLKQEQETAAIVRHAMEDSSDDSDSSSDDGLIHDRVDIELQKTLNKIMLTRY